MLSEYHFQFLDHLIGHAVTFIVIGGQARFQHYRKPTRDLDLWARVGEDNASLTSAIVGWGQLYPSHEPHVGFKPPFDFSRKIQIHYPVQDALYYRAPMEVAPIASADGIDMLLNGVSGLDFDSCFERALVRTIQGRELRFLAKKDLVVTEANVARETP